MPSCRPGLNLREKPSYGRENCDALHPAGAGSYVRTPVACTGPCLTGIVRTAEITVVAGACAVRAHVVEGELKGSEEAGPAGSVTTWARYLISARICIIRVNISADVVVQLARFIPIGSALLVADSRGAEIMEIVPEAGAVSIILGGSATLVEPNPDIEPLRAGLDRGYNVQGDHLADVADHGATRDYVEGANSDVISSAGRVASDFLCDALLPITSGVGGHRWRGAGEKGSNHQHHQPISKWIALNEAKRATHSRFGQVATARIHRFPPFPLMFLRRGLPQLRTQYFLRRLIANKYCLPFQLPFQIASQGRKVVLVSQPSVLGPRPRPKPPSSMSFPEILDLIQKVRRQVEQLFRPAAFQFSPGAGLKVVKPAGSPSDKLFVVHPGVTDSQLRWIIQPETSLANVALSSRPKSYSSESLARTAAWSPPLRPIQSFFRNLKWQCNY